MKFYWVFKNGEYLCCLKAMSEKDAINQAYMKWGSASAYTGNSRAAFSAMQVSM